MAENMENQVIDVGESTGLATTASVQNETEKPADKGGIIGKVWTVIAVASGLGALCTKGYQKGQKTKAAKAKSSNEDNVVEAEPTSEEDEVQE